LSSDGKEVKPIVPLNRTVPNQPQVRLMDQGRALQGVVLMTPRKALPGKAAQLIVDQRHKFFVRRAVSVAPLAQ
jgi:hypothetical protein